MAPEKLKYETELIKGSRLFDKDWYLSEYPDVSASGIEPTEHYLKYGVRLGRNPSPYFDTQLYLASNPDVASAGVNPLIHFILNGVDEGRVATKLDISPRRSGIKVDVVVPVYNALEDVKKCLLSIEQKNDGFDVRIIVVNDGSDSETTSWLKSFCNNSPTCTLIEHRLNRGYTKAVNSGLELSDAPYVVTLNSDTIVTRGWLKALVRCINSDSKVGIAGPLSNAASWQNVPELYDQAGSFAINELSHGMTPDEMADIVAAASSRKYPRVPFVNGFCFMIKREVLTAIGVMDEKNFPVGYGEENDFCIRAADAGFQLAVADDAYVFHAKSKSFGHARRKELSQEGDRALRAKHTDQKVKELVAQVANTTVLDRIRASIKGQIEEKAAYSNSRDPLSLEILFILPVGGGGGGAHSIVQEVSEMQRLGVAAKIAVRAQDLPKYLQAYEDIEDAKKLFECFTDHEKLLEISADYDVVVGTIYSSMSLVKKIVDVYPHIVPAYYVQDYEPLFFPAGSENWEIARSSYTLVPNAILFAKTHWIANKVKQEHGVPVLKVLPSIDHAVYRPAPKGRGGKLRVAAMIRPQTPIRGADRTMRVFSRIAQENPGKIIFHLFGCDENEPRFTELQRDFDYTNHGVLTRPAVAELLAKCDVFVDLSDYQAFGRTALEAMACGCAAVVPVHGGADEYAVDSVNSIVVDSLNEEECFARLNDLLRNRARVSYLQQAGLATAARYSVHAAAVSELNTFAVAIPKLNLAHRQERKRRLMIMPSLMGNGQPAGSGYVRLLYPFSERTLKNWRVSVRSSRDLPLPGAADVIYIQREMGGIPLQAFKAWASEWKEAGGKILFDIDDDLLCRDGVARRTGRTPEQVEELAERIESLASIADIVTVSMPALYLRMREVAENVKLIPNFLDEDLWWISTERPAGSDVFAKKEGDPIRIGYIGTPTHDQDLEIVVQAVQKISQEFGEKVEVEVIGAFERRAPMFGKRVALPKKTEYPNFVEWLGKRVHWDIGIIPLVDDEFNRSKSFLKFIEYSALNLAIVCSDVETYSSVAKDGVNALVVSNTTDAWYKALRKLVVDKSLRRSLAANAYRQLREGYTIQKNRSAYLEVLEGLFDGKQVSGVAKECRMQAVRQGEVGLERVASI